MPDFTSHVRNYDDSRKDLVKCIALQKDNTFNIYLIMQYQTKVTAETSVW